MLQHREVVEIFKSPAAVALGRIGGKKGGPARAKKLSPARRTDIARNAANARWSKEPEVRPNFSKCRYIVKRISEYNEGIKMSIKDRQTLVDCLNILKAEGIIKF